MPNPPATEPGRNAPCPCGSGRKYKLCCLGARDAEEALRQRLRQTEDRLVGEIAGAVMPDAELVEEALAEFFADDPSKEPPEDEQRAIEFTVLFMPWLLFSFVRSRRRGGQRRGPEIPAALAYLQDNWERLSDLDRRFLAAACNTPFSFHVVREVTPGRGMVLHDILTGHDCRVLERSGSLTLERDAILFAKIATIEGVSLTLGCAPLVIPPTCHNTIIDLRQAISKRATPRVEHLFTWERQIRELYFSYADQVRNPKPPVLQNTDGDPLVLTTLEYELRCSVQAAFERLHSLCLDSVEDVLEDATRTPEGDLRSVRVAWMKRGNRLHKEWDNTVLAHLDLEPGRLTANVNSARRADRLRREIAKRLGRDAVWLRSTAKRAEEVMAEPGHARGGTAERPLDDDPDLRQVMQEMAARHWEAWLDQRIPALGNHTPRQAAKTSLGRERLEALLADIAWRADRLPALQRPDIAALRRELGL
jgi:hypothetical protein